MNKSVNLDLKYLILDHCKEVLKTDYDLDALAYAKRRQFLDTEKNKIDHRRIRHALPPRFCLRSYRKAISERKMRVKNKIYIH